MYVFYSGKFTLTQPLLCTKRRLSQGLVSEHKVCLFDYLTLGQGKNHPNHGDRHTFNGNLVNLSLRKLVENFLETHILEKMSPSCALYIYILNF